MISSFFSPQLGQLIVSVNSLSLFTNYFCSDDVDTVFLSITYDEQFYSTKNKTIEELKIKKNSSSKQVYEIKTIQAFSVYNVNRTFYAYLYVITKAGFQKCVGVAKIDNLALQVIANKQRHSDSQEEDVYSILFFPNSHNDSCANNAIAETVIKCTYSPTVGLSFDSHIQRTSDSENTIDVGIRSDSCIFYDGNEDNGTEETKENPGDGDCKDFNMLESAISEFESLGSRSKNFGYIGSTETLCSFDKMMDNYDMAIHFMYRFMIADIKVTIPEVHLLVTYPNSCIAQSHSIQFMKMSSSLCNCISLSLPNMITVTYDTIITPTSRNRVVVCIPTILLRFLKGIDYSEAYHVLSTPETIPHSFEPSSSIEGQRFVCIGEVVCTLRIGVYNSGYSINEPALQNAFILAVVSGCCFVFTIGSSSFCKSEESWFSSRLPLF